MPFGGKLAYDDDMGGVAQDQGDIADSVYQGADPTVSPSMEGATGGCDCAGQGGGDMAALLQNPELIQLLAELLQGGGLEGAGAPPAGGMEGMGEMMGGAGMEAPPAAPPMGGERGFGGPMDEEDEDPSAAALGGF